MHALREFANDHPDIDNQWYTKSNYLGLLVVESEQALKNLLLTAAEKGVRFSVFREPDIGDKITAITMEPSSISKKLCAKLPLAFS
jgi:hypothetical protein